MTTKNTKKKVSNKKIATKRTVVKKEPVEKVEVAEVAVEKETPKKEKKVYEISPFFHGIIVLMTVILWVVLVVWINLKWNYVVTIEHKDVVARRRERRLERLKRQQEARRLEDARHRVVVSEKTAPVKVEMQDLTKAQASEPVEKKK